MAVDTNAVILLLDLCLFLRKQTAEHWDSFMDYYMNELRSAGVDLRVEKWRLKSVVRFTVSEKANVLKNLNMSFGPAFRQYYDLYVTGNEAIAVLAKDIKKKYYITDCSEALLCDIWSIPANEEKYAISLNELKAKGYSVAQINKLLIELDAEKQKQEIYKRKRSLFDRKPDELNDVQKRLYLFFERCDIRFKGEVISDESIIQMMESFYINLINTSEHITAITLHTGSICYQVIGVLIISLLCILCNEWDNEKIISSLTQGESVLYAGNKYIFDGIQDFEFKIEKKFVKKKCFVLRQPEPPFNPTWIMCESKPLIYPYKGDAVSNRGYKSDKRERTSFLTETMDFSGAEITGIISSSAIIVMGKSVADEIIKNLTITCNGKDYSLTDIIRISYFTDSNKDIRYKGNADKNESSIKICPSLSVASEQISQYSDKQRIAVAVFDERVLSRELSNMDLFLNNDLNYSFVSAPINTDTSFDLVEHSERREVFACTKSFLLNNVVIGQTNDGEVGRINRQIAAIVDKDIKCVDVPDNLLKWDRVVAVKNNLKRISAFEYSSVEKDQFVVYAHSVLNFYLTSVFSNQFVNHLCEIGAISVESPYEKHKRISDLLNSIPEEIQPLASEVIGFLDALKEVFDNSNPKQTALESIIHDNRDQKVLILVPKAYYEQIIMCAITNRITRKGKVAVSTYKRIDNTKSYDLIVIVGQFGRFDPELCLSGSRIIYLLYDGERKIFDYIQRENHKKLLCLNDELSNTTDYVIDTETEDDDIKAARAVELSDSYIENELSASVFETQLNRLFAGNGGAFRSGQSSIKVKYVAALEDGRRVLFTQFYKAYVFDEYTESILEKNVSELCPGDMVIFTSQKSATLDVIDDILSDNISSLSEQNQKSYFLTLRWKKVLRSYFVDNGLTIADLGNMLKKHGIKVEPQSVRVWMDDYSHIICPKDPESLRAIGALLEDDDLKQNYLQYFESGKTVKKIRANIRQVVRTIIFSKMTNTSVNSNETSAALKVVEQYVSDNYSNLFDIGVLETISEVEKEVLSTNAINRPIDIQEV